MIHASGARSRRRRKYFEGIAQAVGMVDADAIEHAALQPLENQRVGFFEDVLALDAQADERVDVEEASVAELLIGSLPVGKAIVLLVEEVVEGVEICVELARPARSISAHGLGLFSAQTLKQTARSTILSR